MPPTVAIWVQL